MNYFNFHIGDYLSHTAHLDFLEDLAYRRMLDVYYIREKPFSESVTDICKLIRMRGHEAVVQLVLSEFFVFDGETWSQPRCDDELVRMADKRQKARESAEASWAVRRGKQKSSKTDANAMRTHSERIASEDANALLPTPTPTPTPKKEKEAPPPFDVKQVVGLHIETWQKWVAYRKELNKPLKPASFEAAAKELAKHGAQQAAVVQQSIAAGWQGLFPLKASQGPQGVVLQDPESLALRKLTERRAAIGLADFRLPHPGESSKDYRAAQDQAWAELKRGQSQKAPEITVTTADQRRNLARLSDALKGW